MLNFLKKVMKKKQINLDPRLSLAASFVRGTSVADIGTDHAYIPIYLLTHEICTCAIASDINEGPLLRARANAAEYDVDSKIYFALTDGLDGLPLQEMNTTDIVICGMGGELIARIINESDYVKKSGVNLILQPMSSVEELRYYLADSGYNIIDESICLSSGKLYQCINCVYDGEKREISALEAAIGKINIKKNIDNPYFLILLDKLISRCKYIIAGKEKGSEDSDKEKELVYELENISNKVRGLK